MKKIIAYLLTAAVLLCLCACAKAPENGLQVGFGRADITPEANVPLAGHGDAANRISTDILTRLYTTCIAMTQNEETILLFTQDMTKSLDFWTTSVRNQISAELGIPADRVMICSTHTHSAPETYSSDPAVLEYHNLYLQAMLDAARSALADRSPATLSAAKTHAKGMNFVRHYQMSDGSFAGSNFGNWAEQTPVGYATETDDEMILVKFDRGDDKKDVLLVNWQAHPDHARTLGFHSLSADFIGPLRDKLEADTGMQVAYFTGDTGNLNPHSRILEDDNGLDWKQYGEKLAQLAADALSGLTPIEGAGIKATQVKFRYAMNHDNEDKYMDAKAVVAAGDNEAGEALAVKYGLGSYMEAVNVLSRLDRPAEDTMELNAFHVGGMAFIAAPFEMFSDTGIYIKENSPFDFTLLCTNANEWNSYCSPEYAYEYTSYESSAGHFAKGCAEAVADEFVKMLNSLK